MKKEICPYCDPIPNSPNHYLERGEKLWQLPMRNTEKIKRSRVLSTISPIVTRGFVYASKSVGLLRWQPLPNSIADKRVQLLATAAKKNNIKLRMLATSNRPSSLFEASKNGQTIRFELLPTWPIGQRPSIDLDNKVTFKKLIQANKISASKGQVFRSTNKALQYVTYQLKFPVVIKPADGSLSMHVTANIKSEAELKEAIRVVKIVARNFVVEHYIEGHVYRLLCLDGHLVAASLRQPPSIVGDGKQTIKALIKLNNRKRKKAGKREVPFTPELERTLKAQNLDLSTISPKGKSILLFNKVILAAGADIVEVTSDVHNDFKKAAERAAKACGLPVVGFDIITRDITKSAKGQEWGIIEANTMPFFDMHARAEQIADQIWQIAFKEKTANTMSS